MEHPWLDTTRWPLLVQSYAREATDEVTEAFCAAVEAYLLSRPAPFAWVADATNLLRATARQRQMVANLDKRLMQHDKEFCLGTAIVVAHPLARGIVTAVYWVTPPVYPYKFFAAFADAEEWARARLAEKGLSAP